MQETQVWSLGQEDPPKEKMATHSSILDWRIPWTEKPGGLQSTGLQRVPRNWTHTHSGFPGLYSVTSSLPIWMPLIFLLAELPLLEPPIQCQIETTRVDILTLLQMLRESVQSFTIGIMLARRRQWHPTPVLLLGKSHGWRSLLGCNPWSR